MSAMTPHKGALAAARLDWLRKCPLGGEASGTGWALPDGLTRADAIELGRVLGVVSNKVGWWIGDWYLHVDAKFGGMELITEEAGLNYKTCRNAAICCRAFSMSRRRDNLSFGHHQVVARFDEQRQDELLAAAEVRNLSVRELVPLAKQMMRQARRAALAPAMERARTALDGSKLYGVICADPPWQFEVRSENGMDRAADNHYPTMSFDDICALGPKVPAAPDCVLFLWATVPMLLEAVDVMDAWGFAYRSHFVWRKSRMGTGYWNRNRHELLLLGTKGGPMAPDPSELVESVFEGAVAGHSVKPAAAYEIIEAMFPDERPLEMFARGERLGWDVWGAEALDAAA